MAKETKQRRERITKIEVLNFNGIINLDEYNFFIRFNTKRNEFAHKGKTIDQKESKELFEFSKNIIGDDIDHVIKIL